MSRIILSLVGNLFFILLWMSAFGKISITKNRRLGNLLLSSVPFLCYFVLGTMGTFEEDYGIPLNQSSEIMFMLAGFFGIWFVCCIYAYKNSSFEEKITVNIKHNKYEIITQSPTVIGDASIPAGQDFPYVNNYIRCNDGKIILLPTHPISEKHDLEMEIVPIHKYGSNVYECVGLNIKDNKRTKLEKYLALIQKWCVLQGVLGAVILVPIFNYRNVPYTGGDFCMDVVTTLGSFVLLEVMGSLFSLLVLLYESKIWKIFWALFGGFIMMTGFSYLFEVMELLF